MLTERTIKDTLPDAREALVKVNIKYFEADEAEFGSKEKEFNSFSSSLAQAFFTFASVKLLAKARNEKPKEPYGAVMTALETYNDDKVLCCVYDAFVYRDGVKTETTRIPSVWSKQTGKPMSAYDFFTSDAIRSMRSPTGRNIKRNSSFFICDKGYGFSSEGEEAVIIPFGSLGEGEKISFI